MVKGKQNHYNIKFLKGYRLLIREKIDRYFYVLCYLDIITKYAIVITPNTTITMVDK